MGNGEAESSEELGLGRETSEEEEFSEREGDSSDSEIGADDASAEEAERFSGLEAT